jgi:hypothetical protein
VADRPEVGGQCVLKQQGSLWARSAPAAFTPDNLWERLDGGAAQILDLGFQQLCVHELTDEHGRGVVDLEIFRMTGDAAAQRLFRLWQGEGGELIGGPGEAWRSGSVISFARHSYYVRIYADPDQAGATELLQAALKTAAANVD